MCVRTCARNATLLLNGASIAVTDCRRCPVCSEKVNTTAIARASPWERTSRLWAQGLDTVRYMVVWNPVIIIFIHLSLHAMGLDEVRFASIRFATASPCVSVRSKCGWVAA
jgi:hypothetical protein